MLNKAQKYVASTTLKEPLSWSNSTLLKGGLEQTAAKLRSTPNQDLLVMGSGELIQSLMQYSLADEYVLPLLSIPKSRVYSQSVCALMRHAHSLACVSNVCSVQWEWVLILS